MSAGKRRRTEPSPAATAEPVAEVEADGAPEVGRLVDSSQADDRRMIRLVEARPLLYARNTLPVASYYTSVKELWQQVADEMGWTVAEVRRKWSHIRNSYSRHLRNEMYGVRTGRGRAVSRWYLADELHFLREHMATDTRQSRYSYPSLYLDMETPANVTTAADSVDVKPFISNPWYAALTNQGPPEPAPEPFMQLEESHSPASFDADENSAYFQFFRGIYNDYQELPAKKQRMFRRECLGFLHQLLDEEDAGSVEARRRADSLPPSAPTCDNKPRVSAPPVPPPTSPPAPP